jgi:hypothetical protein
MSFSRKTITLALAGIVGAGFTGAALANDLQQGLTPNTPPQAYSAPSSSSTTSPSGLDGQGATADQANRATSSANAPADRLPANRGQAGDASANRGQAGDASSASGDASTGNASSNPNALYQGNEDAKAVTQEMSSRYNGSDLNASQGSGQSASPGTDPGTAQGADASASPDAGNLSQGHPPVEVYRRSTTIYLVPDQAGQSTRPGSPMESQSEQSSGAASSSQGAGEMGSSPGSTSTNERFHSLTGSGAGEAGATTGASSGLRNDTSGNASERSSNLNDRNGSNANASSQWSSPAPAESSGATGNP